MEEAVVVVGVQHGIVNALICPVLGVDTIVMEDLEQSEITVDMESIVQTNY